MSVLDDMNQNKCNKLGYRDKTKIRQILNFVMRNLKGKRPSLKTGTFVFLEF